jgi:hypothetical protein
MEIKRQATVWVLEGLQEESEVSYDVKGVFLTKLAAVKFAKVADGHDVAFDEAGYSEDECWFLSPWEVQV